MPAVAGAGFKRAVLQSFRDTMAANMNLSILINLIFAGVIAFGVVYNAARVSLSERSRELASLRVLGFTRAEISLILLGELALLTLAALPVGAVVRLWALEPHRRDDSERGLSLSAVRLATGGGLVVSGHHRRGGDLGAARATATGQARSRGGVEGAGVTVRIPKSPRLLGIVAIVVAILAVALWPSAIEVDVATVGRGADAGDDRRGRRDARARAVRRVGAGHGTGRAHRARTGRSRRSRQDRGRAADACAPRRSSTSATQAELTAAVEAARAAVGQAQAERQRARQHADARAIDGRAGCRRS